MKIFFIRGKNRASREMRKAWATLLKPLKQEELFPTDVIVHFGNHKNLTAYYSKVLERLSEEFLFDFCVYNSAPKPFEEAVLHGHGKRVLSLSDSSDFDLSAFPPFRGSRFIRDPRDLIVSGYRYHLWTKEPWCVAQEAPGYVDWSEICTHPFFTRFIETNPQKFPAHISYQNYLNSLNAERGMILEMIWREFTFDEMRKWQPHANIIEFKYEEIIGNEVEIFRQIFEHYQFHPKLIQRGLKLVDQLSLKNIAKGAKKHVRKGTAAQWKQEFSPPVKEAFKELNGNLLIQLGYEQDLDW